MIEVVGSPSCYHGIELTVQRIDQLCVYCRVDFHWRQKEPRSMQADGRAVKILIGQNKTVHPSLQTILLISKLEARHEVDGIQFLAVDVAQTSFDLSHRKKSNHHRFDILCLPHSNVPSSPYPCAWKECRG